MAKEYIEREALYRDIENSVVFSARNAPSAEMRGANKIMERIKCAPAADVVEVVHGRWEARGFYGHNCSVCGALNDIDTNYCPTCGARMDGEK